MNVQIYTKTGCGYCHKAKQLLELKQVPFEEILLDGQYDRQLELAQQTGCRTVPQIFVDGSFVGDCETLLRLERENQLDAILKK
jgi:glutaredoxin 3